MALRVDRAPRKQGKPRPRQRIPKSKHAAATRASLTNPQEGNSKVNFGDLIKGGIPKKVGTLMGLIVLSRAGTYIPLPGVDVASFQEKVAQGGVIGFVDQLAGGSISKVGVFSLGIVPFINSSILLQLVSSSIPSLQKLQKEEGEAGRRKFQQYQRYLALGFALAQAVGQCLYIRPFVADFSPPWLVSSVSTLTAGAMALMYIGEIISELRLGNGTSLIIFSNIVSSLPASAASAARQASDSDKAGSLSLLIYFLGFALVTSGIVYVQEAERKISITYASRQESGLGASSYLPFKVNSAGVMPIIFSSSLISAPQTLARFTGSQLVGNVAGLTGPGGPAYLPTSIALIAFFNYFYTFLQLDPQDVAEQLKKQGASIPGVRPGRSTADYLSDTLSRMSIIGSVFLAALSGAPTLVELVTHVSALRGFAGTSVLILVGVATDSVRRIRSEALTQRFNLEADDLYSNS